MMMYGWYRYIYVRIYTGHMYMNIIKHFGWMGRWMDVWVDGWMD